MPKAVGRPNMSAAEVARFRATVGAHALAIYRADGFDKLSMRRLAKEIGCSATTLYAHFNGKIDILMQLWADVLDELVAKVQDAQDDCASAAAQLTQASQAFVAYWVNEPEHFRLVFMSNDVTRADVEGFVTQPHAQSLLQTFSVLVAGTGEQDVKRRTETLLVGLLGVCLCHNTLRGHDWTSSQQMVAHLVHGVLIQARA